MDPKFPTEIVELPSKGLLYPETHPLSSGKVEIKYMTAYHEDILTNINYIKQDIVLDKLLQSLIVTKFNYDDLLIIDKEALLLAARILGYGKEYSFNAKNPINGEIEKITVDLTTIEEKKIDESIIKKGFNEFSFELPFTTTAITFKFLNLADDKIIEAENKGLKKINANATHDITTTLIYTLTSVGGSREKKDIREFVNNGLLARDRKALSEYIKKISPGILWKTNHDFGNGDVEVAVPIGVDFFWPE